MIISDLKGSVYTLGKGTADRLWSQIWGQILAPALGVLGQLSKPQYFHS